MDDQYSAIYGGFVVRPVKQLPSLPLSKLHELRVTVRDQMLSPRPTLGSFYLANVERNPQVLCRTFIGQAKKFDEEQRKNAIDTADSYWLQTLNMAIENAANKKDTRYAADIDASLFTPDSNNEWEISGFCKSFLPFLKEKYRGDEVTVNDQCRGFPMPGINNSQIMLGFPGSMTGFHVEDNNFASVNYNHTGAPKYWILMPSPHTEKARTLFKRIFPEEYVICEACDLHKRFFVFPQLLTLEEIPFHTIKQGPGEYVYTFLGALHRDIV
jgi:hypothetical protein